MYDAARFAEFQKNRLDQIKQNDHVYLLQGESGYSALAAAILYNAIKDWKRVQKKRPSVEQIIMAKEMGFKTSRQELIDFFHGDELESCAGMLGIPPDVIRKKLDVPNKKTPPA